MSEFDPENPSKKTPYRRLYRYGRQKYDQYAQWSRANKHAIGNYANTKYEKYGHWKYVKRLLSVLTVVGLFIYTGVTSCILIVSSSQLRLARSEFQLTQRPWMQATITFVSPLSFDTDGGHVSTNTALINSGHSPAVNVMSNVVLVVPTTAQPSFDREQKVCSEAKNSLPVGGQLGFTFFPSGQPGNSVIRHLLKQADIEAQQKARGAKEIIFRLYAWIDYHFTFADGAHQTSYIYEIEKVVGRNEYKLINPNDGEIQPASLIMLTDPTLPGHAN